MVYLAFVFFLLLFALDILSSYLSCFLFLYIRVCVIFYTLDKWICVYEVSSVSLSQTHINIFAFFFVRCWCVSNSNRIYIYIFFLFRLVELPVRINVCLSVCARFYSDIIIFLFSFFFLDVFWRSYIPAKMDLYSVLHRPSEQ
jgi:hypothetical protein